MRLKAYEMKVILTVVILQLINISTTTAIADANNGKDASILVMGLSGAGVFSTVEKLVKSPIHKNESSIPVVTEYSWPVLISNRDDYGANNIRIAWSPGLVNGKSAGDDARAIATIREYIQNPKGLNKQTPSIVIVVSRFDETIDPRSESNSNFVRMLGNVETLKDLLTSENEPTNIIFHFTHLMGKGIDTARLPNTTIDDFKRIITRYTSFPEPILASVGENRPDEHRLMYIGGYTRLPNKQLYPKNVVDLIRQTLTARGDYTAKEIVTNAYKDPFSNPIPEIATFSTNDEIENSDENQIQIQENFELSELIELPEQQSDINKALQTSYDNLDEGLKRSHPNMLQLVQESFQKLNITSRHHLPKTTIKTVELFQKIPFHMTSLALLQDAFDLRQPEFIYSPVVGQGYDILKDETVTNSPYVINIFQPTSIGYSLPNILRCRMETENAVDKFKLIQSYDHYKESRLQDLSIKEPINSTVFIGTVRSGYNNIRPDADTFVALTAVQETRNFKLDLIESSDLNDDFQDDVYNLSPFNLSNRESPKEWKSFFNKYGTHVVSEAYGGGYMEGKASGEAIRNNLRYNTVLHGIKDNLLSFRSLPNGVNSRNIDISHSFFGGSPDPKLADVHRLPSRDRESLLRQWKDSVRSDPRIMEFNLKLTPISTTARLVNDDKGHEVQIALEHLLKGTLVYIRPKSPKTSTKSPDRRISSATATNPYVYNRRNRTYTTTTVPTTTLSNNCANECSETPPCPMCPQFPVCNFCETCPSTPTEKIQEKTCPLLKSNDFTNNIIGQGYHLLKDSVLQGSPFSLEIERERGIVVPHGASVEEMRSPCLYIRFNRNPTYSDYVAVRLNSTYKPLIPIRVPDGGPEYSGFIRSGYNIMDKLSANGPFSIYEENRYFEVKADLKKFHLRPEFVVDVNALPSYLYNSDNCTVQDKWITFFNKYGTHVVTEGYAGTWQNAVFKGLSANNIARKARVRNSIYETGECLPLKVHELQMLTNAAVSIESAKLQSLKDVLDEMDVPQNFLSSEYDVLIMAMLENRLKGC